MNFWSAFSCVTSLVSTPSTLLLCATAQRNMPATAGKSMFWAFRQAILDLMRLCLHSYWPDIEMWISEQIAWRMQNKGCDRGLKQHPVKANELQQTCHGGQLSIWWRSESIFRPADITKSCMSYLVETPTPCIPLQGLSHRPWREQRGGGTCYWRGPAISQARTFLTPFEIHTLVNSDNWMYVSLMEGKEPRGKCVIVFLITMIY